MAHPVEEEEEEEEEPPYGWYEETGAPREALLEDLCKQQTFINAMKNTQLDKCDLDDNALNRLRNPQRKFPELRKMQRHCSCADLGDLGQVGYVDQAMIHREGYTASHSEDVVLPFNMFPSPTPPRGGSVHQGVVCIDTSECSIVLAATRARVATPMVLYTLRWVKITRTLLVMLATSESHARPHEV